MPDALFYPWIDIPDEGWLKTALLYWDAVRTIVPESIDVPYSTDTARILKSAGFLIPLRVHSGMDEIETLAEDVLAFLGTPEAVELLSSNGGGRRHDIHFEKMPDAFERFADIHVEKLPYEIRRVFRNLVAPSERGSDWLHVDERFADYYMTMLANRLADREGAHLLTSLPAADRLAVSARLDAQLNGLISWGGRGPMRHWREYDAFGPRRKMPRQLAQGMIAHLAIERIGISPDTPLDRLIDFKERHRDELGIFRAKINELVAAVETDLPVDALRRRIADLHAQDIAPAISNLKAALKGQRIKWLADGLSKTAFISVGSSALLVATGLSVPTALLAGAGISLIATRTMYNVDRNESLRANPFSYLLSVERELQ